MTSENVHRMQDGAYGKFARCGNLGIGSRSNDAAPSERSSAETPCKLNTIQFGISLAYSTLCVIPGCDLNNPGSIFASSKTHSVTFRKSEAGSRL